MQVNPYLSFQGDCEAAFDLYARCLGGRLGPIFLYGGTPLASNVSSDWANKVMHASVTLGEQILQGADVLPEQYEAPKGFSLSVQTESTDDAERVFRELGEGGKIVLPLEKTFWSPLFGMVVDRYGIPWMINCEAPVPPNAS